jgi:hypothetical protein
LGSGSAYAVTCASDVGVLGTAPYTCDVTLGASSGLILHTINFGVDSPYYLVTITSTTDKINFFSLPIFENLNDDDYIADSDGTHTAVDLSAFDDLVVGSEYHVHRRA